MANDDLIEQIRELRAQVRRGDEAIRTVADLIEHCIALKTADRGYIEGTLGGWLRRDYVRIVRGETRTQTPPSGAPPVAPSAAVTPTAADYARFVSQAIDTASEIARSSPLLEDNLLESLRPLFASGRTPTGAEVRDAVLRALSLSGFTPCVADVLRGGRVS